MWAAQGKRNTRGPMTCLTLIIGATLSEPHTVASTSNYPARACAKGLTAAIGFVRLSVCQFVSLPVR